MVHPNDTGGNRRRLLFGAVAAFAGKKIVAYGIETLVVEPALEWVGDKLGIEGLSGCSGFVTSAGMTAATSAAMGRRMAERAENSTSSAKSQRNAQAPQHPPYPFTSHS